MNNPNQPNTDPVYLASQGLSPTTPQRFMSKIRVDEKTGCWIWTGMLCHGYGIMSRWKKNDPPIKAATVAWILFRGPIPEGLHMLHKCPHGHNKACANFEHLKPGTRSENMQDVVKSGNHYFSNNPSPRGSANPNSKLSDSQKAEIRRKYAAKEGNQNSLAREFGVRQGTIWNVLHHVVNGKQGVDI